MLLNGSWHLCDDGILRPGIRGNLVAAAGRMVSTGFLVDTAADRTVLSADLLRDLALEPTPAPSQLLGVGGTAPTVTVTTAIHIARDDGGMAIIRGEYAAFTNPAALDMCVLGRDVVNPSP